MNELAQPPPAGFRFRKRYALYLLFLAGAPVLHWRLNRPAPVPGAEYIYAPPQNLSWFRDAKFGVMITWGPASLTGKEISWSRQATRPGEEGTGVGTVPIAEYDQLYKSFNPTQFDAAGWIELFRKAGAKYIVFVTKHHDGFCMFDSRLTDYNITHTPYGKDITAQLADACHQAGLKLGFYYSQPDWRQPDYRTKTHQRYIPYLHGHIHELCLGYGQVDLFWFDGLYWRVQDWDSEGLFRMIRRLQPHAIINNRAALEGDFDVREQDIGYVEMRRPWETCMTIGKQWAYKPDDVAKSRQECISSLLRAVGTGGNFLLNVGPRPDGSIEPVQSERLRQIGEWLTVNGEGVYGTRAGPYRPAPWGVSTHRDRNIYLHILTPPEGELHLPAISATVTAVTQLAGGGKITFSQDSSGVRLQLKPLTDQPPPWVVRMELTGTSPDMMPER